MPILVAIEAHFRKHDRIGRRPLKWDESTKTTLGGLLSFVAPIGWVIFFIYCIYAYMSTDEYASSTSIKAFPSTLGDTQFYLPKLTCIAPKGCFISPMAKYTVTRDVTSLTKACYGGDLTLVDDGKRKPPGVLSNLETEAPFVEGYDVLGGRECIPLACGDTISDEQRLFYFDYDAYNGFHATWENGTRGFAYEVPYMDDRTGLITHEFVKLSPGVSHLSLVRKKQTYFNEEIFQFLPIPVPIDAAVKGMENACCSAHGGNVNCNQTTVSQLFIRPLPTFVDQRIQKQFAIGSLFGLSGGAIALFYSIAACCVGCWKRTKSTKRNYKERRADPGHRNVELPSGYEIEDIGEISENQLSSFTPVVQRRS